jgi:GTPase SAR1 family protein
LLEIPKEHRDRLLKTGELTAAELTASELEAEELRRKYFSQPLRPVLELIDEALQPASSSGSHRLVILGDPGSGKSSLVRYLALRWAGIADPTAREAVPVPLVIELGSYGRWQCEGQKGLLGFLEQGPVWHKWSQGLLEYLLTQPGRVVLLLDGLDEIFDVTTREDVVNDLQRFSNEHAHTPIVVTSRVVGYQPQRLRNAEFRHFMLQDLDASQIDAFIDRWHEETFESAELAAPKRERLKKGIHDSTSIAMLAGNPLLLTMMAILNRNQELPRDRVDLYERASRLLLDQWDTERALKDFPGLSTEIGWREKSDMLRTVASFMQAGPSGLKGNMIAGPMLGALIEKYLRKEKHFDQSHAAAGAVLEHLRVRNFILCFVGADSYSFVHRTFLEYFCAADFVHRFNITKTLTERSLIASFDRHCRDDDWREVLRLICGQIDEQSVGRIVERLAAGVGLMTWNPQTRLVKLELAICCLCECRVLERIERAARRLMRRAIALFRKPSTPLGGYLLFLSGFIAAYRELGSRWPGRDELLSVAVSIEDGVIRDEVAYWWPDFVAHVTSNRDVAEQLCSCARLDMRRGAVRALATKWPDERTRELVTERLSDVSDWSWNDALRVLTEKWPDERTRELVADRAVAHEGEMSRGEALELLIEKWPDETTRVLLTERAVVDEGPGPRCRALQFLTAMWPDDRTRELLTKCAVEDPASSTRGFAASLLARTHSAFGRIVFTRDLEGREPYLDPHNPLPPEHVKRCAAKLHLPSVQLEKTLAELSQLLGWDVTVGARPKPAAVGPADV